MRFSAVFSALFHVAIIVGTMVVFADPLRFVVDSPTNIPVELLTPDDVTNIRAAILEEDIVEALEDEPAAEEEPPEPRRVEPEPEPEPVLEEAIEEFSPFEEAEPEVVEAEPEPAPPPVPDMQNVRQRIRPEPPNRAFDFAAAEALIDLTPEEEQEEAFDFDMAIPGVQPEISDERRARVGLGTDLTIGEEDLIRSEVEQCWNVPAGAQNAENLLIELRIHFNADNSVREVEQMDMARYRSDGFYRAATDSAIRAVERCQTGTNFDGSYRRGYSLPTDREWQAIRLIFDPSNMF